MKTMQNTYYQENIEQVIYDENNHLLESCCMYDEIEF